MSREFTLEKDLYDNGFNMFNKKKIIIEEGVTVLVGCNGIGKTTLLKQIKEELNRNKTPYIRFDNLEDGGANARSNAGYRDDFEFLATSIQSSEGENIVMNMTRLARKIGEFVRTGIVKSENPFEMIIKSIANEKTNSQNEELQNERWILLDAVDSGLSIDNIVDLKECLFKTILEHNFGNKIYIIVSANEFEMARNEKCFDVYNGKYLNFKDYEEFRKFILKSKEWKDKRYK